MPRVLVVGGGYAGFDTAWHLERKLRRDKAEITVVDPRPYMTYQPFLPAVVAGSVGARPAAVSLRRHLRRTDVIAPFPGRDPAWLMHRGYHAAGAVDVRR